MSKIKTFEIYIDSEKKRKEIQHIEETEYFKILRNKANLLKKREKKND